MKNSHSRIRAQYQSSKAWTLALQVAGCCLLACAAGAARKMPPGAYLAQPVTDARALTHELDTNRQVRLRYARTFNMAPAMVKSAFASMKLKRLTSDHVYEVHYVHPGETVGSKFRRVRKGTLVYVLPDGTPALAQVCGNPLRKPLLLGAYASRPRPSSPQVPVFSPEEALAPPARSTLVLTPVAPSLAALTPPPGTDFIALPNVAPPDRLPAPPALPQPLFHQTAVGQLVRWLNPVTPTRLFPALAAPLAGLAGWGGSRGASPPVLPVGPSGTPEPGSLALLAATCCTGVWLAARRARARHCGRL